MLLVARGSDSRWTKKQRLAPSAIGISGSNGRYRLLGVAVGDGVAAGAGVTFVVSIRILFKDTLFGALIDDADSSLADG
jgi:hypothetical protein